MEEGEYCFGVAHPDLQQGDGLSAKSPREESMTMCIRQTVTVIDRETVMCVSYNCGCQYIDKGLILAKYWLYQ